MDLSQFVKDSVRTESKIDKVVVHDGPTALNVLQLFLATSELLDMIKKNVFYRREIDKAKWDTLTTQVQMYATSLTRGQYLHLEQPATLDVNSRLFHAIIGAATESGELVEHLLNMLDNKEDGVGVLEEFGDINWYEAIAIDELNADFEKVLTTIIEKLRKRFPDKYDDTKANNRDLEVEREVLEDGMILNVDPQKLKGQDL